MKSKAERVFYRGALALAVFFFLVLHLPAQTTNVSVSLPPDWVRSCDWKAPVRPVKNEKSEGVRQLLLERQEHPQRQEDFTRVVLLMENESGVQDSGSLSFDFDPSFQELILHCVQIHRGGKVLQRLDMSKIKIIQPERGLEDNLFTGELSAVLFVEDLRVGDVLEYACTVRGANPILNGHYSARFGVQRTVPVDRQRIRVVWSSARPLYLRQHLTSVAPRKESANGITEYLWDFSGLPAVQYEDWLPTGFEPFAYVEFSDFDSWARVVEWALPLYGAEKNDMPAELRNLIQQWQASTKTTEEKARTALQFVQDELRYTGLELGPDSYRPAQPFETFRLRYGDCKGKAALLCAVLREMKIEAYPALVNTSSDEALARRLPSPFAFDHVIVKLVLDGKAVWVDPTLSFQGGTLRNRFVPRYGKALVLKQGVAALEQIPPPRADQLFRSVTSMFELKDYTSPASLVVKTLYHGAEADDMREYLARTDAKEVEKDYINFYARYYPGVHDPRPLKVEDDRNRNVLEVTEQYRIRDFWELDKSSKKWEAPFYADCLDRMIREPDTRLRKMPLRIPFPMRREQEIVVHLPDNEWNIAALEHSVEHEAFSFRYRRALTGSTVRFHYECETKQPEVKVENVAAYLKKLEEMQDLLGDTLFRPDNRPRSVLTQMNWLMVVVAGFGLAATLGGSAWAWRVTRPGHAGFDAAVPPPLLGEGHLQGLGGWLILVGLGLCAGPIWRCVFLMQSWEGFFSIDVWQAVAVPAGEQFHPLYGPLLIFELLGNTLFLGLNVLVICLFFARRRFFPLAYIAMMVGNVLFLLMDEIVSGRIPYVVQQSDGTSSRGLSRAIIGTLVWCIYMVRSRRVKATFVR